MNFDKRTNGDRVEPFEISPNNVSTTGDKSNDDRVRLVKKYAISICGFSRIGIILAQLGAWISCILILKYPFASFGALPNDLAATRYAFLTFSIVGFVFSIVLYLFYLLNIKSLKPFNKIPDVFLDIIVLASDILWLVPMLVLSIFCVVRVNELQNQSSQNAILNLLNTLLYSLFIDVAAFTSTVVFGFICAALYAFDAILQIISIFRNKDEIKF